jgi:hypothetical protein
MKNRVVEIYNLSEETSTELKIIYEKIVNISEERLIFNE